LPAALAARGMSDHRVPGTRAPLEDANARATRQRAMDARGLGPSGQYRLRCVVTSPWQPARVPADASGRARRRSRFRWRRSGRSARPLIGNRSPSVWPVREGRAESQRDPRLPRTPMADRQMSLPSSWPARQRPDIGCHLCVRQRIARGRPRGSHGITLVRIPDQVLRCRRQFPAPRCLPRKIPPVTAP
jgi:hypothetical protein